MKTPYSYQEKYISDETRSLLDFRGVVYEIIYNGMVDTVQFTDKTSIENLVILLNRAYNRGLNKENK